MRTNRWWSVRSDHDRPRFRNGPRRKDHSVRIKHLARLVALCFCFPLLASVATGQSVTASDFRSAGRFLEFSYGTATPKFKGMDGSFASLGILEFKSGYSLRDSVTANVIGMDDFYSFGSYMDEDLRAFGTTGADEDVARLGRFGIGNRMGYGYDWQGTALELYNQNSINWTTLHADHYPDASDDAQAIFDRYGTQLRFGQLMEAGAKFHVSQTVAFTGGMEGAVIFPRYVFWPWLGSVAIYSIAEGAVELIADQIMESNPTIGPVAYFLLKNGLSLAYYSLLRGDMAWPFNYEQPLTVESFKLGLNLTF